MAWLFSPWGGLTPPKEPEANLPFRFPEFSCQVVEALGITVGGLYNIYRVPVGFELWVTAVWGTIDPGAASRHYSIYIEQENSTAAAQQLFFQAAAANIPDSFGHTYAWPVYVKESRGIGMYLSNDATYAIVGFTGWVGPKVGGSSIATRF